MEEDHLVRRIRRRAVHLLARRLRRQVSVLREELAGDRARDALEVRGSGEPEAAEQDRPVLVEPRVDLISVRAGPCGKIDPVRCGLDDEREQVVVEEARLDELRHVDGSPPHRPQAGRLGPCFAHRYLLSLFTRRLQLARCERPATGPPGRPRLWGIVPRRRGGRGATRPPASTPAARRATMRYAGERVVRPCRS